MSSYTDPGQHIFWIASRAFGVVALILVAVSVGLGLAMAMRSAKGPGAMARLKQAHEATALTALIFIVAHGLALLGDTYLRPGLSGVAIPFVMAHRPLWTGLGVVGRWRALDGGPAGPGLLRAPQDRPEAVAEDAPLDAGRLRAIRHPHAGRGHR